MYEQLLKLEAYELAKKSSVSWERILEIRHLKDRMIRKCSKLSKTSSSGKVPVGHGGSFGFQTIIAPSDFRVKEMEKWFRQQQKRVNSVRRPPIAPSTAPQVLASCCSRCAAGEHAGPHVLGEASLHHVPSFSIRSRGVPSTSANRYQEDTTPMHHSLSTKSQPVPRSKTTDVHRQKSLPPHPKSSAIIEPPVEPVAFSPPPLPHPYRHRELDTSDVAPITVVGFSQSSQEVADPPTTESPPTYREDANQQVELRRRRSCIKRSSVGDIMKTVSWADDRDWGDHVSKFVAAAREAQASGQCTYHLCQTTNAYCHTGRKWEEIRSVYQDQLAGLDELHQQVDQTLERLRSETQHLQRVDDTIRRQRENLSATFGEFEQTQTQFQVQGQFYLHHIILATDWGIIAVREALEEAGQFLALCTSKKELEAA